MSHKLRLDRLEAVWSANPVSVDQARWQIWCWFRVGIDDAVVGPAGPVVWLQQRYGLDPAGVDMAFGAALRRVGIPGQDVPAIVDYGLVRFLDDLHAAGDKET
jgi:hypothetical protein